MTDGNGKVKIVRSKAAVGMESRGLKDEEENYDGDDDDDDDDEVGVW
jgi:hypothetical protein